MGDYRVNVISNLEDWEQVRGPWNELLEKSASPNLFLTWEWMYSWAECFLDTHKRLFIPVVYAGDELIAVAPWYINHIRKGFLRTRQIDFIGTPEAGSDYLDVLIKKKREREVTEILYNFLFSKAVSQWDSLRLFDIPSNSLFLLYLLRKIRENGKYAGIQEASFCPIANLPKTEEEFLAGLSSSWRQTFKRNLKTIIKLGTLKYVTYSSNNLETALKEFFVLYTEKTGWLGDDLLRLIAKVMNRGIRVQIDFLAADDKYIGGLLHLRYKKILYMYLMAIDKSYDKKVSIGNVLIGRSIIGAIQSDISCYDFLKGPEDYKFHWTNYVKSSTSLVLFRKGFVPVCHALADVGKSALKIILR